MNKYLEKIKELRLSPSDNSGKRMAADPERDEALLEYVLGTISSREIRDAMGIKSVAISNAAASALLRLYRRGVIDIVRKPVERQELPEG